MMELRAERREVKLVLTGPTERPCFGAFSTSFVLHSHQTVSKSRRQRRQRRRHLIQHALAQVYAVRMTRTVARVRGLPAEEH